ncbi:hypothetical protein ABT040_40115 [Streptomyces sp. NPDC002688]|uniref:hypothetical protein n=1 Tax=Streptomyces sp. NPDC002688 TaxID=3154423 RepID=UPI00332ED04B
MHAEDERGDSWRRITRAAERGFGPRRQLITARDHHRVVAYRKRAYALLLVLYTCCLRIDALLNARVEHLGYDKGHHVLRVKVKGGGWKKKPIPPVAWDALQDYLDGRTDGWLFCTRPATSSTNRRCGGCCGPWRVGPGWARSTTRYTGQGRRHHARAGEEGRPDRQGAALG